jgi:hypothetical protein
VSAAGGAVTAGTNSVIAQTGKNFSGFNQVDWEQVGISSAIGGVAGFAGGSAGYAASNASVVVNGISSPALRSAVVSPLAAGAGHIAGGTTANLIAGQNLGDAFTNSFEGLGKSMAIGGAIGVATTVGVSYANGVSPWTGNPLFTSKQDFFEETSYSEKVLGQMEQGAGEYHSFPESVKAFQNAGNVKTITGADGITRQLLEISGTYNGKNGTFHFIKEHNGVINHRFFKPY